MGGQIYVTVKKQISGSEGKSREIEVHRGLKKKTEIGKRTEQR